MPCDNCRESWFWKKIGRCTRCMKQLTVLVVLSWIIWPLLFRHDPRSIQSVTLLFAALAFHLLLLLHVVMRWIILPARKRRTHRH